MKRKTIYAFILICCLGLISSANQSNKECATNAVCLSAKVPGCCQKAMPVPSAKESAEAASVPLNLFLFEL